MRPGANEIVVGLAGLTAGGGLVLVALGVVPVDAEAVHMPLSVLALVGSAFVAGGAAALVPVRAVRAAAGGLVMLTPGLVFGWIALFGDAAQFSGGSGLLPRAADVALARGLFGAVALLGLGVFVAGTARLVRDARRD